MKSELKEIVVEYVDASGKVRRSITQICFDGTYYVSDLVVANKTAVYDRHTRTWKIQG